MAMLYMSQSSKDNVWSKLANLVNAFVLTRVFLKLIAYESDSVLLVIVLIFSNIFVF